MTFAEKLVFLMNLTSTTNKQLAAATFVDPSFISLLRTARREAPRSMRLTRAIADILARRCDGVSQRRALAEAMRRGPFETQISTEQVAALLFEWLSDGRERRGGLTGMCEPLAERADGQPGTMYFGNDGKRAAVDAFLSCLAARLEGGTVLLTSDENDRWLMEEPGYLERVQEQVRLLLKRGFRFRRIAAPIRGTEQAADALARLVPLYLTAQVESYYYPRLRDGVHRRTLLVLPGAASLTSSSVGDDGESKLTLFSQDRRVTKSLADDFNDYLQKCLPVMAVYSTAGQTQEMLKCVERFEAESRERIQMSASLSAITTPPELIPLALHALPREEEAAVADTLLRAKRLFQQSLSVYGATDIHRKVTAEEVRGGQVPIAISHFATSAVCYTPDSYALHLKSILEHMRIYPGYRAVFRRGDRQTCTAMVKNGQRPLLFRAENGLSVYELCQPGAAETLCEHLTRLAEKEAPPGTERDGAMQWIQGMIRELEG